MCALPAPWPWPAQTRGSRRPPRRRCRCALPPAAARPAPCCCRPAAPPTALPPPGAAAAAMCRAVAAGGRGWRAPAWLRAVCCGSGGRMGLVGDAATAAGRERGAAHRLLAPGRRPKDMHAWHGTGLPCCWWPPGLPGPAGRRGRNCRAPLQATLRLGGSNTIYPDRPIAAARLAGGQVGRAAALCLHAGQHPKPAVHARVWADHEAVIALNCSTGLQRQQGGNGWPEGPFQPSPPAGEWRGCTPKAVVSCLGLGAGPGGGSKPPRRRRRRCHLRPLPTHPPTLPRPRSQPCRRRRSRPAGRQPQHHRCRRRCRPACASCTAARAACSRRRRRRRSRSRCPMPCGRRGSCRRRS